MSHDVFISHSSKDKVAADATCAVLESRGIRCWIAPRDVISGQAYGASIIEALNRARVMVLIFSGNANKSQQVMLEVERAVNKGIVIIPVRIENILPTESLELFLGARHWLDAYTPPMEKHLNRLAQDIRHIIGVASEEASAEAKKSDNEKNHPKNSGIREQKPQEVEEQTNTGGKNKTTEVSATVKSPGVEQLEQRRKAILALMPAKPDALEFAPALVSLGILLIVGCFWLSNYWNGFGFLFGPGILMVFLGVVGWCMGSKTITEYNKIEAEVQAKIKALEQEEKNLRKLEQDKRDEASTQKLRKLLDE